MNEETIETKPSLLDQAKLAGLKAISFTAKLGTQTITTQRITQTKCYLLSQQYASGHGPTRINR